MENISPVDTYLASLAAGSRRTMRVALGVVARQLSGDAHDRATYPWEQLRYRHLVALRSWLEERYAPATANKILSAVRGVVQACADLDLITQEQARGANKIKGIKASGLVAGRMLTLGEQGKLMAGCGLDPAGGRDAAILAVMLRAGLRRSEVVALDLADWDARERMLQIRGGKGNKDRQVPLPTAAVPLVARWLQLRGQLPGPLFTGVNKSGAIATRRLTDQAILVILDRLRRRAGIATFTSHDCRRTYISTLFDVGVDIAIIQQLAGHSDPSTTAGYDRRPAEVKARAVDLLPDL